MNYILHVCVKLMICVGFLFILLHQCYTVSSLFLMLYLKMRCLKNYYFAVSQVHIDQVFIHYFLLGGGGGVSLRLVLFVLRRIDLYLVLFFLLQSTPILLCQYQYHYKDIVFCDFASTNLYHHFRTFKYSMNEN